MRLKAVVNACLFLLFLLAVIPQVTGVVFHEWVSLVLLVPLAVHLLTDWNWIVRTGKRFFGSLRPELRFNFCWDALLFINMVVVTLSGVMISEALLPAFGWQPKLDLFWTSLHDLSSNLIVAMLGVHLAMHWQWIKRAFRRLVLRQSNGEANGNEKRD